MKKILIHNDNGRRDLLGLKLLERALISQGFKVFFANRTALRARIRRIQPDAVIMARGDNPTAEMASAVCRVYILPSEGARTTKETTLSVFLGRGYSAIRSAGWIRRCYLWNEKTKDWLLETGMLAPSQIKVVGNPRLDIYRCQNYRASAKKRVEGAPLRIGIAFSATTTSAYYGPPHFAETYHDHVRKDYVFPVAGPGRHFEDLIWRDHAILRNMMHLIKEIGESTTFEMFLRPNPLEGISEYHFLEKRYPGRLRVTSQETLPEFLSNIDVLLTCWSTTGIEALLNDIPVISINGLLNPERLFDHISKEASGFNSFVTHYHTPKSVANLMDLLELAKDNKLAPSQKSRDETAVMLTDIFGWKATQPSSCSLIAEDIAKDLDSMSSQASASSGSSWKTALPLRYSMPPIMAEYALHLRDIVKAMRSGEYRSYMSFLSCDDPHVTQLLRRVG